VTKRRTVVVEFVTDEEILGRWTAGQQMQEVAAELGLTPVYVSGAIDRVISKEWRWMMDGFSSTENSTQWNAAYDKYTAMQRRHRKQLWARHAANRRQKGKAQ
jgi:hypothetical protein